MQPFCVAGCAVLPVPIWRGAPFSSPGCCCASSAALSGVCGRAERRRRAPRAGRTGLGLLRPAGDPWPPFCRHGCRLLDVPRCGGHYADTVSPVSTSSAVASTSPSTVSVVATRLTGREVVRKWSSSWRCRRLLAEHLEDSLHVRVNPGIYVSGVGDGGVGCSLGDRRHVSTATTTTKISSVRPGDSGSECAPGCVARVPGTGTCSRTRVLSAVRPRGQHEPSAGRLPAGMATCSYGNIQMVRMRCSCGVVRL